MTTMMAIIRFCVGDRFYLLDNKILCEYDYEERKVFASLPQNMNSLEHLKRKTHELLEVGSDGASSGYGSHSEDLNQSTNRQTANTTTNNSNQPDHHHQR